MSELIPYINAVAIRKSIDRKTSFKMNAAVVMQLEEKDLPLLLEIIREFNAAIVEIIDVASDEDGDETERFETMGRIAAAAHLRTENLAAMGCKKKWGEHAKSN